MKSILRILPFFFLLFMSPVCLADDAILGTWEGSAHQPGYGSYKVVVKMGSGTVGSVEYPTMECGGNLVGTGSEEGVYLFKETITYGGVTEEGKGCITGGTVRLSVRDENLYWEWSGSYKNKGYLASSELVRIAGKNCAECGQAIFNDISYGVQITGTVDGYVSQALKSYEMCTKDILDGCENTCGRQLYEHLPACEIFSGVGYHSCITNAMNTVRRSCA